MFRTQGTHKGAFFPTFLATFHWFFPRQFIHFTSPLVPICISIFSIFNTFFATSFYTLIPHTPTSTQTHKNSISLSCSLFERNISTFWIISHEKWLPPCFHVTSSHHTSHNMMTFTSCMNTKNSVWQLTRISGLQESVFFFFT